MHTPSRRGAIFILKLLLAWSFAPAPAAELPAIRLSGVVERVESHPFGHGQLPPPWDQVQVGDAWSVTYRFDPAAPDTDPSPSFGAYPTAIQGFVVTAGTITRTNSVGPATAELRVFNDQPPGADQYEAFFNWEEGGVPLLMFFQLDDLQNQSFATDALPDCLDLASFDDAKGFQISAAFGGGSDGIQGRITGIACSPRLVQHPQGLTVTAGQPASFEVEIAPGGTPATYQWERDCGAGFQPIGDATNRVHAIAATTPADACQYRCVVSSLGLGSTSLAAALNVQPASQPPVITQQPQGATLVPGETLTLGVTATGTGPLRHQWTQLGHPPTPRGTNPVLVLGPVSAADAGQYVVEVRDDVDAVVSNPAAVVVVAPGPFADDFEGYASGADLHGQGGWHGWAEDPAAGGLIHTDRAFSPTRSVCVQGAGDLARRLAGVTGGRWVLRTRQYLPSSSTGTTYLILLSKYRPPWTAPGDLAWSVQLQFNLATGRVISDLGDDVWLPLVKDQWVEIRCEIDLDANTVREFYNGELLAEHPWRGADGDSAIAAVNLYAHDSGPACYDDVRLDPAEAPVITQEPQSQIVEPGGTITLQVIATGTEPLRYHWIFCPRPNWDFPDELPPPTQSTLTITNIQPGDFGDYLVVVANSFGMVTSQVATVMLPCLPPPPGLVAWWPMDETTGTTVDDLAGWNDQGTPVTGAIGSSALAPASVAAMVGNGLCFPAGISPSPGPNVYIEVPSGPEVNFSTNDFSIDAWIKLGPGTGNIYPIVDKLDFTAPVPNRGYALFVQGGQLLIRLGPDNFGGLVAAASTFSSPITMGQWHFIAVTVERTATKPLVTFYLDGVPDGPHYTAGPDLDASRDLDSTTPLWIGGHSRLAGGGATVSRGEICIDELEYFHLALAPATVQSLYAARSSGKCKQPCINPPPGMVAWWPADNNATDIVGGNNGILVGGATFTASGMVGSAFSLDGVNDYVRIPTSPSLNPSGSFTIDAWIYVAEDGTFPIVTKWGDSGAWNEQRAYALHTTPGRGLNFAISDDPNQWDIVFHTFTTPGGEIPLNTWTLVAAVYDQSTGTRSIFVNGLLVASRTDPPITITASIADMTIGNWLRSPADEGYFFPGMIDEVEFFNRALSQQEIQAIYNAGSAGKCKNPCQGGFACAPDKTAECGTAWSFDPPTSIVPGCTLQLLGTSTVTNATAPCQELITRTWTFIDCCGHTNSCMQTVTVRDTTPPVITASGTTLTPSCNPTAAQIEAALGTATARDNCAGTLTPTATTGSLSTNGCQRSLTRTWNVSDPCGNAATPVSSTVTWTVDTTPPAVTSAQGANATIQCPATPSFSAPVYTDACAGVITPSVVTVTNTVGCTNIITRTWTATDPCGNTTNRSQTITVLDTTPPMIDCAGLQALAQALTNACTGVIPDFCLPQYYSDLCCGISRCVQTPPAGTPVGPGTHSITLMVSDLAGNSSQCIIPFTVNAPMQTRRWNTGVAGPNAANFTVIAAPGTISTPVPAIPTVVAGGWLANTADSAWVSYRANSQGSPSGVYVYRLQFDLPCTNGASITGRFATDDTSRIQLNGQPTTAFSPGFSAWTTVSINNGLRVGGNTLDIVVTNAGTWTGLRTELVLNFTCCCPESVVMSCPPSLAACVCGTNTTALVNYQVTASNRCGNPIVSLVCTPPSGSSFPLGTTWVTCVATDSDGNQSTCSFPVTVSRDITPLSICCPADIVRYACTNALQVFYSARATDNCAGTPTITYNPPSGSWFAAGTTTTVTATATDACGNSSQCTFKVTVRDERVWQTFLSGVDDCYRRGWLWWWRNPEPVSGPSACLLSAYPAATWKQFDNPTVNRFFGNSWQGLPGGIVEAYLDTRMRPPVNGCDGVSGNDSIHLGLATCSPPTWLWTRHLGTGNPSTGLVDSSWCNGSGCNYLFSFNLAALPAASGPPVNLLPHMNNPARRLDLMVQDDTTVDYARLRIRYCLPGPVVGGLNTSLTSAIFGHRCWWWWIAPDPGLPVGTPFSAGLTVGGAGGITVGTTLSALPTNAQMSFVLRETEATGADTNTFGAVMRKAIKENGVQYAAEIPLGVSQVELVLALEGQVVHAGTVAVPPGSTRVTLLELLDMETPLGATLQLLKERPPPRKPPQTTLKLAEPRVVEGAFGSLLVDTVSCSFGDLIFTFPEDGFSAVDLVVSGVNVPEIELKDIQLEVAGDDVAYGGDALARVDGGQLVLSPFDPAEGSPVWFSVACAPTNELRVLMSEAIPTDGVSFTTNATLTLTTRGIVGGVEQDLPALRHSFNGTTWGLSALQDDMPVPLRRVELWSGGTLVAQATDVTDLRLASPPPVTWPLVIWFVDADICHRGIWPKPVLAYLNGQPHEVTEVRVQTDTYGQPVTAITGQRVESTALGALVFAGLETGPATYLLEVPELGPDGVTIRWGGIGGVLEQAPTVNGPWTLVPGPNPGEVTLPVEGAARFLRVGDM